MDITGIGTTRSYTYCQTTKKLGTQNSDDAFVKWYNGEINQEQLPAQINGFDDDVKRDLETILSDYSQRSGVEGYSEESMQDNDVQVTVHIRDVDCIEYNVNGIKITSYSPVLCSPEDEKIFCGENVPYATTVHQDYNAANNSIQIAVGDEYDVGNGYKLVIGNNSVDVVKTAGADPREWDRVNYLSLALSDFIHFADQQWMSMESSDEINQVVIDFLQKLGVNTEETFTVNKTQCEIVNGRIREVGNMWCIPSSMYNAAKKRYEELMSQSINKKG
ncbi:MAG: hypothetical protein IJF03_00135 [Lachnospiraceae bacterium]|nr:hypothetical protein [Lachnospiraceae bacterium]